MTGITWDALQKTAKESGFVVLAASTYEMEIAKSEACKTKDGSKDMIKVTLKVVTGPMAGKGSVIHRFTISPDNANALFFFFTHMKAFGLDDVYFGRNPKIEQVAKDLLGRRALVDLTVGEYNGNEKNDVGKIQAVSGGPQAAPVGGGGPGIPNITPSASPGVPNVTPPAKDTVSVPPPPDTNGKPETEEKETVSAAAAGMPPAPF